MSKKELEKRRREEQEATAHAFQDFIKTFQDPSGPPNKLFVHASILNTKTGREESTEQPKIYNPQVVIKPISPTLKNAIECARLLKESKIEKKKGEKPKSNLELLKEELKLRHLERHARNKSQETSKNKNENASETSNKDSNNQDGKDSSCRGGRNTDVSYKEVGNRNISNKDGTSRDAGIRDASHKDPSNKDQYKSEISSNTLFSNEVIDETSTNLFVANINPKLTEQDLMHMFGAYGPLASVKIMWPRGENKNSSEKVRGGHDKTRDSIDAARSGIDTPKFVVDKPRPSFEKSKTSGNCGFVAFMSRRDAERALLSLKHRDEMRLGWGKPVKLPHYPIYMPPELISHLLPPPYTGLPFNAQPLKQLFEYPKTEADMKELLYNSVVKVTIPLDKKLLGIIHRMIEFVVNEGPMFEAVIMNKELNNINYQFLFDNKSASHVYYRWKLYSILQGESTTNWSDKKFRMFKDGPIWVPPLVPNYSEGMPEILINNSKFNKKLLSEAQESRLIEYIQNLTPNRVKVGEAMVFSLDHRDASRDIVKILTSSFENVDTHWIKKIARLYFMSDVLHNSWMNKFPSTKLGYTKFGSTKQSTLKLNCSKCLDNSESFENSECSENLEYREEFMKELPNIFVNLHNTLMGLPTADDREAFKIKVGKVLRAWDLWKIYPLEFLKNLGACFMGCDEGYKGYRDVGEGYLREKYVEEKNEGRRYEGGTHVGERNVGKQYAVEKYIGDRHVGGKPIEEKYLGEKFVEQRCVREGLLGNDCFEDDSGTDEPLDGKSLIRRSLKNNSISALKKDCVIINHIKEDQINTRRRYACEGTFENDGSSKRKKAYETGDNKNNAIESIFEQEEIYTYGRIASDGNPSVEGGCKRVGRHANEVNVNKKRSLPEEKNVAEQISVAKEINFLKESNFLKENSLTQETNISNQGYLISEENSATQPFSSEAFIKSKWETIDPETLESQAMSTKKFHDLELERLEVEMKKEKSPTKIREERNKLRQIEVMAMQYQDEIESGKKKLKKGKSVEYMLVEYRNKLMARMKKEGDEKTKKELDYKGKKEFEYKTKKELECKTKNEFEHKTKDFEYKTKQEDGYKTKDFEYKTNDFGYETKHFQYKQKDFEFNAKEYEDKKIDYDYKTKKHFDGKIDKDSEGKIKKGFEEKMKKDLVQKDSNDEYHKRQSSNKSKPHSSRRKNHKEKDRNKRSRSTL